MHHLRGFTARSASDGSRSHESAKTPPSSPFTLARSATSANLNSSTLPHVRPPLPNTDPLPTDPGALEGLLNHHASQLKKLADRVESVNEWIEMDGIVLERLLSDAKYYLDREEVERADTVELDAGPVTTPTWLKPQQYRSVSASNVRSRTPIVHFQTPDGQRSSSEMEATKEDSVTANCNIRDIRERIKSMKRWRKELERSVYWQREEYWRIEKVMGKKRDSADLGRMVGEDGWGVGGKTWEKGSGRLPTQVEWEVMFGSERMVWDEQGARPKF